MNNAINRRDFLRLVSLITGGIHFAGEHASAYHGWIQGAIGSGNRVAKEANSF